MDLAVLLLVLFVVWLIMAGFGAYVGGEKGRDPIEGAIFGFLLGPFGLLIVALLPSLEEPEPIEREWLTTSEDPARAFLGSIEPPRPEPPKGGPLPDWLKGEATEARAERERGEQEAIRSLRVARPQSLRDP
jgi:hypothetical protein